MKAALLSIFFSFFLIFSASAQTIPAGFTLSNISSGWDEPVGAAFSKDGLKLFVWEKGGRLYVCNRNGAGNYIKQATPVLNISEEVGNWRDHGMLGFALDPNFDINGLIYVLYVVDRHYLMNYGTGSYSPLIDEFYSATIGRLTRYHTATSAGNLLAEIPSRTILLGETKETGIPVLYESHGVGSLAFAADGMLLVTCGEGASYFETDAGNDTYTYWAQALADHIITPEENVGSFRAQMLTSLGGKLLRLDPTNGNGVGSNPFFDAAHPRSAKSRIWALGFRNPFRMTIKPGTGSTNPTTGDIGEVYVGDVGWGVFEELSVVREGGTNCGWPMYEGYSRVEWQYSDPSYYQLHTPNPEMPNPLYNGTTCTQQYLTFQELLKEATADNIKIVYNPCNPAVVAGSGNRFFHHRPILDWRHGLDEAHVGIFNGNNAAVAVIGTPESHVTGTPFMGNASVGGCWYTGNLFPAEYKNTFFQADYGARWLRNLKIDFTDVVQKVTDFASNFSAIVAVTENPLDGTIVCVDLGDNSVKKISYGGNYLPVVRITSNKIYGPTALSVNFSGTTSSDPDGGSIVSYAWNFGDLGTATGPTPSHTFTAPVGTPTKFVVKLTVTDDEGGSSTDSLIISVNNTPPVVNITSPVKNSTYKVGQDTLYTCTATVTDAEHTPAQLKYAWQTFLRHNNHQHPEKIDSLQSTQTRISRIGCNGDDYYWFIKLTVTDAAGLTTIDSSKIFPQCTNGALPLVLKSFSVTQDDAENLVKWTTELEENIDHFEVERSTDGVNFTTIYKENARNLASASTYGYTDNTFSAGITYYRLKIVEKDNAVRYSIIIKTSVLSKDTKITIAPVPVIDNLSITYTTLQRGMATIYIRDAAGRVLKSMRENVNKGINVIYVPNLPGLKAGTYFITVEQGSDLKYGKFVKM